MSEKPVLAEALRAEILKLASEGDQKSEGALTADVLLRIMRVAKTGRDLLVSLTVSPASLEALIKRQNKGFMSFPGQNGDDDSGLELSGVNGPMGNMIPLAGSSSPAENFGMTAIREMIAAAKSLNGGNSPARLVEAIAIAKEKGLDDIAKDLEAQLGIGKDKVLEKIKEPEKKETTP